MRTHDNTGLRNAVEYAYENNIPLRCVFIFDTTILSKFPRHDQRLRFVSRAMQHLIADLDACWIEIDVWVWDARELRQEYITKNPQCTIFANRSYGRGAGTRDSLLEEYLWKRGNQIQRFTDYLLVQRDQIPARKVFTPFYNIRTKQEKLQSIPFPHQKALALPRFSWSQKKVCMKTINEQLIQKEFMSTQDVLAERWPITWWKARLQKDYSHYDLQRNIPSIDWTTQLSPYIRFGLVSIREVFWSSQWSIDIVRELAWREFWYHIFYYFPHTTDEAFQEKKRGIQRENDPYLFEARKEWKTGYALVDAGMRQLKQEWWIHNRVRMVVASFLTKDLLIDRRRWEQHFADYLLDYDRAVNTWNRQWASSVGADPKPLRIFNPSLQAQRFDPTWAYIQKYCPEWKWVPMPVIFDPERYFHLLPYPCVISHKERIKITKERYKGAWILD